MKFFSKEDGENEIIMVTTSLIHENDLNEKEIKLLTEFIRMLHGIMIEMFKTKKSVRIMVMQLFCMSMVKSQTEMLVMFNDIKKRTGKGDI